MKNIILKIIISVLIPYIVSGNDINETNETNLTETPKYYIFYNPPANFDLMKAKKEIEEWETKDPTPLEIIFDKEEVKKVYKRWKAFNTGTYVYICKSDTIKGGKALFFIKNNNIVKFTILPKSIKNDFDIKMLEANTLEAKSILMYKQPSSFNTDSINVYLIDNWFKRALSNFEKLSWYDCHSFSAVFNTKYPYISSLKLEKKHIPAYSFSCKSRPRPDDITHILNIYSYGLIMLPQETKYTNNIVKEVLKKYEKFWKCGQEIFLSKREYGMYNTLWRCDL